MKIKTELIAGDEQYGMIYDDHFEGHSIIGDVHEFRRVWHELGFSVERKLLEQKHITGET